LGVRNRPVQRDEAIRGITLLHEVADAEEDLPERRVVLASIEKFIPEISSARCITEDQELLVCSS
jgi:hypothetical protein